MSAADRLRLHTAELRLLRAMVDLVDVAAQADRHVANEDDGAHYRWTSAMIDVARARDLLNQVSGASVLGDADPDDDQILELAREREEVSRAS